MSFILTSALCAMNPTQRVLKWHVPANTGYPGSFLDAIDFTVDRIFHWGRVW